MKHDWYPEEEIDTRYEAVAGCCHAFSWLCAAGFFFILAGQGLAMWYAWPALIGTSGWFLYNVCRWIRVYFL